MLKLRKKKEIRQKRAHKKEREEYWFNPVTGFYLKASPNTGKILGIFVAPINGSNVNEKGDFNIIHSDSFSI